RAIGNRALLWRLLNHNPRSLVARSAQPFDTVIEQRAHTLQELDTRLPEVRAHLFRSAPAPEQMFQCLMCLAAETMFRIVASFRAGVLLTHTAPFISPFISTTNTLSSSRAPAGVSPLIEVGSPIWRRSVPT